MLRQNQSGFGVQAIAVIVLALVGFIHTATIYVAFETEVAQALALFNLIVVVFGVLVFAAGWWLACSASQQRSESSADDSQRGDSS